jgi:phospholipid/cholesterol/gamma-HCH transport system substrate-binding protein
MKLPIRFADQIVGGLIILALGIMIFVIFMLGSRQRWFSRDYQFKAYFSSANGLSQNMSVQYKGFTIGHVKSIGLAEDDRVEVHFTIFDTYIDRVKHGSLVDVSASPIGLGNSFLFYPGLGNEPLPEGATIPSVNSEVGKSLIEAGLAVLPEQNDSISNILNYVTALLADIQGAIEGTDATSLGRIIGGVEMTVTQLPADLSETINGITETINVIKAQVDPILENFNTLSREIANPDGTVMAVLDTDREIYTGLASSLDSVSGILKNLEKTTDYIPPQMPQIFGMLADVNVMLRQVQDVLTAVLNNPLLKGGVPERKETKPGGAHSRDIEF